MNTVDIEYLRRSISYNPDTGVLVWLDRPDIRPSANSRRIGTLALNNQDKFGYRRGMIRGVRIKAHRAAWAIYYGEWPDCEIDHINRDPSDNRIENLRLATTSENGCNKVRLPNNTSGYKGVSYYKAYGKWEAYIEKGGKRKKLGYFDTPEEAHAAYCAAAEKLHKEFMRTE